MRLIRAISTDKQTRSTEADYPQIPKSGIESCQDPQGQDGQDDICLLADNSVASNTYHTHTHPPTHTQNTFQYDSQKTPVHTVSSICCFHSRVCLAPDTPGNYILLQLGKLYTEPEIQANVISSPTCISHSWGGSARVHPCASSPTLQNRK